MDSAPSPVPRREIFGWAMFDFANSSYTTVIVTVAFGPYFTTLVAPGRLADWLWGLGITASNLLVVLAAPLVGAVADDSGRKKLALAATYLLCVAGTAGLYFATPGRIGLALAFFVVSNVAFSMGENLIAAFLPEVATPRTIGRVSGLGWGLGYLGGLGCLLAVRPLLRGGFTLANLDRLRLAWLTTAAFFLLAGVFTFVLLRERAPRGPRRSPLAYARVGWGRLAATARSLRHFAELMRFLAIFFVYSCGLMTVIAFAGIFAVRTLGFSSDELTLLFIVLQLSSAAGAVAFGVLQDRAGARRTIQATLLLWIAVCVATYACQTKTQFWGIGLLAGVGIGSLQAASRGLVGLFSPVRKSGEFFAFWGLAGKGAYALGPAVFGAISAATGSQRLAILATAAFFVAGFLAMFRVDEARGRAAALAWSES